jgi:hypothetical protein
MKFGDVDIEEKRREGRRKSEDRRENQALPDSEYAWSRDRTFRLENVYRYVNANV